MYQYLTDTSDISILAPREGSDFRILTTDDTADRFLSSLPARGATLPWIHPSLGLQISILAPREGSDDGGLQCGAVG